MLVHTLEILLEDMRLRVQLSQTAEERISIVISRCTPWRSTP